MAPQVTLRAVSAFAFESPSHQFRWHVLGKVVACSCVVLVKNGNLWARSTACWTWDGVDAQQGPVSTPHSRVCS